ncbi:NUDIX hydrolase [Candidatus Nomurabacteria bacterium]|nr:NUDIX hydrolase [Candidatus Kaiserbacteria bacterium]MCB9814192.1 NUDIX hydrolase [Candidatus Nomurabacteria bacterium]
MKKGIDYIGVSVAFRCHDGKGNYVMHRRNVNCRDEHGCWDFGGGGLKFGETIADGLSREVKEEYGADIVSLESLGHREVFREHDGVSTHWISFAFKVLVDPEQVVNNEPDKHDEIGWFTADSLPTPLHSQLLKNLKINPL